MSKSIINKQSYIDSMLRAYGEPIHISSDNNGPTEIAIFVHRVTKPDNVMRYDDTYYMLVDTDRTGFRQGANAFHPIMNQRFYIESMYPLNTGFSKCNLNIV